MKKTILFILTLGVLAFGFKAGDRSGVRFRTSDWKDVTKEAKDKDKPIFVAVCAPWCANCARMKEQVFPDEEVGEFFNEHFVSMVMNSEDTKNNIRVTNWGVKSVPTMVFLTPEKRVVYTTQGYKDKKQLLQEAQIALSKLEDYK
jgi:thioredoxin-related protein